MRAEISPARGVDRHETHARHSTARHSTASANARARGCMPAREIAWVLSGKKASAGDGGRDGGLL